MAVKKEKVEVEVSAKTGKASSKLKKLTKVVGGLGLALGGAFAAKKVIDFGIASVQAASDFEEVSSKFEVVFRGVEELGNKSLKDLTENFGLSAIAAKGFLASLQDTFVPLGFAREQAADLSGELTRLAADVASFNNVATADVLRDFQSALVGSTLAVRKYGIVITEGRLQQEAFAQGIGDGTGKLTEQEKVLARYGLILGGTTDAQGDFNRTQESFANQSKILSNRIEDLQIVLGEQFLPIVTAGTKALIEFVEATIKTGQAFGLLSNKERVAEVDLQNLATILKQTFRTTADTNEELLELSQRMIEGGINFRDTTILTDMFNQTIEKSVTNLENLKLVGADIGDIATLGDVLSNLEDNFNTFNAALEGLTESERLNIFTRQMAELGITIQDLEGFTFADLIGDLEEGFIPEALEGLGKFSELFKKLAKDTAKARKETESFNKVQKFLAKALDNTKKSFDKKSKSAEKNKSALQALNKPVLTLDRLDKGLAKALDDTATAFVDQAVASGISSKALIDAAKSAVAGVLKQIAKESLIRAVFELASGFASLAVFDVRGAGQHFAAAALFGTIGVASIAGASALGGGGETASPTPISGGSSGGGRTAVAAPTDVSTPAIAGAGEVSDVSTVDVETDISEADEEFISDLEESNVSARAGVSQTINIVGEIITEEVIDRINQETILPSLERILRDRDGTLTVRV